MNETTYRFTLIRGLHGLRPHHRGCVATIGNFDGVHLGHLQVLELLKLRAQALGLPSAVVIFEPLPAEYFAPDAAPPRLTRLREKVEQLRTAGIDRVLCLHFDRALAGMPAEEFIRRVLVEGLGVRFLVVGDDFRFGPERRGDFAMLVHAGTEFGFEVTATPSYVLDNERVSSTRIRNALAAGDLEDAARLLGRPYAMCGRVARGDQRGRQLGFPTANVQLHRRTSPLKGVFAVTLAGVAEHPLPGVANIGNRPTVDGTRCLLEVHLLDFSGDIYRKYVQVAFLKKLRDEQKFASLDALKGQIGLDTQAARLYFDR